MNKALDINIQKVLLSLLIATFCSCSYNLLDYTCTYLYAKCRDF
jgi:hypothetical protein